MLKIYAHWVSHSLTKQHSAGAHSPYTAISWQWIFVAGTPSFHTNHAVHFDRVHLAPRAYLYLSAFVWKITQPVSLTALAPVIPWQTVVLGRAFWHSVGVSFTRPVYKNYRTSPIISNIVAATRILQLNHF